MLLSEAAIPSNASLSLREAAFIDGRWISEGEQAPIAVHDPATNEVVGHIPDLDGRHIETALAAASRSFAAWRALLPQERGRMLDNWAALIRDHQPQLALTMTAELGKPLKEASAEIEYGASFVSWFAAEASRTYGETIPSHLHGARLIVSREPVGPSLAITPWNFPSAMILRKAAAALCVGCPVIVMPSPETPFSALGLAQLAEKAGLPIGVFQVVTGDPARIGPALVRDDRIRAVSFTGSTEVGQQIATQAASGIKRVSLELGGHAPFIVLGDADIDDAVAIGIQAKYATSGQDCLAVNRFFVALSLYDRFCDAFAAASARLNVGNGREPRVDIGPLIGPRAIAKCLGQIEDARRAGARILTGGAVHPAGPNFLAPTVLADVTDGMRIASEETFGPVAAITPVADEAAAIGCANVSKYGLAAYVVGRDVSRVLHTADALDYGMVAINSAHFTGAPIPFGGFRRSGLGREGGRHGIEAFSELKYICMGGLTA